MEKKIIKGETFCLTNVVEEEFFSSLEMERIQNSITMSFIF